MVKVNVKREGKRLVRGTRGRQVWLPDTDSRSFDTAEQAREFVKQAQQHPKVVYIFVEVSEAEKWMWTPKGDWVRK